MQRYRFRLEAVLKVRRMHEETCRNELGMLMVERQHLLDRIAAMRHEVAAAYTTQEKGLAGGMRAGHAAFFPQLVEGKNAHIKQVLGQIEGVEVRIEAKRTELQTKRAELKAVENLKEKDLLVWRKAYNKETDQKVEEMVQLWGENRKTRGDA